MMKLIGDEAKVLISSEWDFVPFTYPMSLDILPKFALLGGPATESNNVLVLPLAGHEIGHSVWRSINAREDIQIKLVSAIEMVFIEQKEIVSEIVSDLKIGELEEFRIKQAILVHSLKQCEEIFCDAIGLGLFSNSFLYSYEYFMAPGGNSRSFNYPSETDRIKYLKMGCEKIDLPLDPLLFTRWNESVLHESMDRRVVRILDEAVAKVAGDSIDLAFGILKAKGMPLVNLENVARIESSFERGEPEDEHATVAEIVCAGWSLLRKINDEKIESEHSKHKFLGELMLKSIEISEFRGRIESNA